MTGKSLLNLTVRTLSLYPLGAQGAFSSGTKQSKNEGYRTLGTISNSEKSVSLPCFSLRIVDTPTL